MQFTLLQKLAIWILPVLFAITVHEVAHGWVANLRGDRTAKMLGRLTLNPLKHLDPIGTVIVPIILLMLGGFIFGWAKPVPVTWKNLKNPKRDMALVAVAGPLANLGMAFFWGAIAKLGGLLAANQMAAGEPVLLMGQAGILINLVLMVLNLIPIPPLDGSRIVSSFLSGPLASKYEMLEPYGFFILVGLIVVGALGYILGPPVYVLFHLINAVFGLGIEL